MAPQAIGFAPCPDCTAGKATSKAAHQAAHQAAALLKGLPYTTATGPSALEAAGKQAARAHYTSQVLHAELAHAHQLITLLLRELTPAGLARFAKASEQAEIGLEGATRHHERAAALALAEQHGAKRHG